MICLAPSRCATHKHCTTSSRLGASYMNLSTYQVYSPTVWLLFRPALPEKSDSHRSCLWMSTGTELAGNRARIRLSSCLHALHRSRHNLKARESHRGCLLRGKIGRKREELWPNARDVETNCCQLATTLLNSDRCLKSRMNVETRIETGCTPYSVV